MDIRTPVRASHSYTQHLVAPPQRVFPLLCPVRETEWVRGWAPRAVISASGRAGAGRVFFTPGPPAESIWVVTEYRPDANRIAFVRLTPGHTLGEIRIRFRPAEDGGTLAEVAYAITAEVPVFPWSRSRRAGGITPSADAARCAPPPAPPARAAWRGRAR